MKDSIFLLAEQLGKILLSKNWHISCAESCTGGGIAYAITSTAGSSAWFNQSFVTYSNDAKNRLIDVRPCTLDKHGAVSSETVVEMVTGTANQSQSDIAISVSGIAGPGGGSPDKPVGTVWFGFWINGHSSSVKSVFVGDRAQVREKAIEFALQHCISLLN